MRVEGESGERRGTGRAGAGGRRLTLAPRPWVKAKEVSQEEEKVRAPVFADSDEESEFLHGWEARSSVGSSADPLAGLRLNGSGSRFWLLAVDDVSEEALEGSSVGDADVSVTRLSSTEETASLREAVVSRQEEGEVHSTITLGFSEPEKVKVRSTAGGTLTKRSGHCYPWRPHGRRVFKSMAAGKPWKGPVPPARPLPKTCLGDVWVRDLRDGGQGHSFRFGCMDGDGRRLQLLRRSVGRMECCETKETGPRDFQIPVSTRLPVVWAGAGHQCGGHLFRAMSSVGAFLARAGKPRGFPCVAPHAKTPGSSSSFPKPRELSPPPRLCSEVPSGMAGRQWEEREFRAEREGVERGPRRDWVPRHDLVQESRFLQGRQGGDGRERGGGQRRGFDGQSLGGQGGFRTGGSGPNRGRGGRGSGGRAGGRAWHVSNPSGKQVVPVKRTRCAADQGGVFEQEKLVEVPKVFREGFGGEDTEMKEAGEGRRRREERFPMVFVVSGVPRRVT